MLRGLKSINVIEPFHSHTTTYEQSKHRTPFCLNPPPEPLPPLDAVIQCSGDELPCRVFFTKGSGNLPLFLLLS